MLRFAVDTAKAVFKAGVLYMAGKAFKRLIPSTTAILWIALVVEPGIGFLWWLAIYLTVPYALAWLVKAVWGNEITNT